MITDIFITGGEGGDELVTGPDDDKMSHVGTLETLPDENCFTRFGSKMEDYITTAFTRWGLFVARNPWLVIFMSV